MISTIPRTTEDAFGIHEYLNYAGNTPHGVKPMTKFARAK
ncbi:phosphoesterase [Calothrix sp. NIES-4071]|nr:phosphoesterase [Calothrix sp. NIES-4071]BAZ54487.1 phosphoesterase [Calothrix sp. NIES-4105]